MGIVDRIKAKVAYDLESRRMGQEQLRKVAEEMPFPPFLQRIRMTNEEVQQWRRQQNGGRACPPGHRIPSTSRIPRGRSNTGDPSMTEQSNTELQLRMLQRFVEDQPAALGWEVLDRGGVHFANRTANVTGEWAWHFQLLPRTPENSPYPHARWEAVCQKGEDEKTRKGSLGECTSWLADRQTEWTRERQAAAELQEFAEQPKWKFYDQPGGRHYAGRQFEYSNGDRFLISILPNEPVHRRVRFRSQINAPFAAGPEHVHLADTIDGAISWVTAWEKLLSVPQKLHDCSDLDEAREVVRRLSSPDVACLGYLLDIAGGVPFTRDELVRKFAGVSR